MHDGDAAGQRAVALGTTGAQGEVREAGGPRSSLAEQQLHHVVGAVADPAGGEHEVGLPGRDVERLP